MALLHELADAGHTIILITHDREVAAQARRVIEIRDGPSSATVARPRMHPHRPCPIFLTLPPTATGAPLAGRDARGRAQPPGG
jgi:macrolide transport system ATP-binding/permease protein